MQGQEGSYGREILVVCNDVCCAIDHLLQIRPSLEMRRSDLALCTDAHQFPACTAASRRSIALGWTCGSFLARDRLLLLFGAGDDDLVSGELLDEMEELVTRHLGDALFRREGICLQALGLCEQRLCVEWAQGIELVDDGEEVRHQHLARAIRVKLCKDAVERSDVFFGRLCVRGRRRGEVGRAGQRVHVRVVVSCHRPSLGGKESTMCRGGSGAHVTAIRGNVVMLAVTRET
jgi:hypothetical protein